MKQMSSSKSAARDEENLSMLRKIKSAGHGIEFSIRRDHKGLFAVSAIIHHRAGIGFDTAAYLARFFNLPAAKAYVVQMEAGA